MMILRSRNRAFLATFVLAVVAIRCGGTPVDPPPPPPPPPSEEPEPAMCAATGADDWLFVDVAEGQKPVLDLSDGGEPHIAFMFEDDNGWVKVTSLSASTGAVREVTTIDQGYFYGPFGLTVAQGRSFVAYHDHAKQDMVLQVFEITQEWFMHRLEREGHDGWHSALTIGPIGSLHAVTIDPAGFNGDGIVYTTFAEGVFAPEIAAAGSINYDWGLSIDVASDGTVYVAFFDAAEGVAKVARRNGPDNWEVSVVEPVPSIYRESGRFPQIKVDESNNLYLAYLARSTTPNEGAIRYATGTFGNLTVQEVAMVSDIQVDDMFDFTELGMHGARNIVDLDLDGSGDPVLAYQSRSVTYIARWNGSGFDIEQLPVADGEELRQEVSMELDGADRIHLSFWIESATGLGQICYARR